MPKPIVNRTDISKALDILNDQRWERFVSLANSPKDRLELSDEDVEWCWDQDVLMENFSNLPSQTILEYMDTMSASQKWTLLDTIRFYSCLTNVESDMAWDGMMDALEGRCSDLLCELFKALGEKTTVRLIRKNYREAIRNAMKA